MPVGQLWSAEIVFRSSMKPGRLKGGKPFWSRIGIHTGNTLVGNIGSANRMNYAVVGDSVNLASQLEGINKIYQTNIIVSSETQKEARSQFLFRPLDIVRVKGKKNGVKIFELLDSEEQASEKQKQFCFVPSSQEVFGHITYDASIRLVRCSNNLVKPFRMMFLHKSTFDAATASVLCLLVLTGNQLSI